MNAQMKEYLELAISGILTLSIFGCWVYLLVEKFIKDIL